VITSNKATVSLETKCQKKNAAGELGRYV